MRRSFGALCLLNFAGCDPALLPRLQLGSGESGDRHELAQMYDALIHNGVIWKRAKFIREDLGLPPLDPDEERGLEQEQQGATGSRTAPCRRPQQPTRFAPMSDAQAERAIALLCTALSSSSSTRQRMP